MRKRSTEKKDEMKQWLSSHPDKQPKDWLLECRCDDHNREPMRKLLATCDSLGIKYHIPYSKWFWDGNILPEGVDVEFDISFGNLCYYDMDTPRKIFASDEPKYSKAFEYLSWKTGETRTCVVDLAPKTFAMYKDDTFFSRFFYDWQSDEFLYFLKVNNGIK